MFFTPWYVFKRIFFYLAYHLFLSIRPFDVLIIVILNSLVIPTLMSYLNLVMLILLALWICCFVLPFHTSNCYLLMSAIFCKTVDIAKWFIFLEMDTSYFLDGP